MPPVGGSAVVAEQAVSSRLPVACRLLPVTCFSWATAAWPRPPANAPTLPGPSPLNAPSGRPTLSGRAAGAAQAIWTGARANLLRSPRGAPAPSIVVKPLRVLIVEDVEDDAILIVRQLRKGGFATTYERVETAAAMRAAVARPGLGPRHRRLHAAAVQRARRAACAAGARHRPAVHHRVRQHRRGDRGLGHEGRRSRLHAQGEPHPAGARGRARAARGPHPARAQGGAGPGRGERAAPGRDPQPGRCRHRADLARRAPAVGQPALLRDRGPHARGDHRPVDPRPQPPGRRRGDQRHLRPRGRRRARLRHGDALPAPGRRPCVGQQHAGGGDGSPGPTQLHRRGGAGRDRPQARRGGAARGGARARRVPVDRLARAQDADHPARAPAHQRAQHRARAAAHRGAGREAGVASWRWPCARSIGSRRSSTTCSTSPASPPGG